MAGGLPRATIRIVLNGCRHFVCGVIFTVLTGEVVCAGRTFRTGDFFLLPAAAEDRALVPTESGTAVLRTTIP